MGTLVSRSLVLQARRLLPSMSREERQVAKFNAQIQKLLAKRPDQTSGRGMLVSDLFKHLRGSTWLHSTRDVPADVALRIFKGHVRTWDSASAAQRRTYELL